MHRVVALVIPQVVAFDLSIPAQIFGHAEERERYDFAICTEHPGEIATTTGFSIQVELGLDALADADTVVVPGYMPIDLPPPAVSEALAAAAVRGARMASVCIGAFGLAAAGLLDGRRATTHWEHAPALAARFPAVRVNPDVLYIDEGQVLTSAGVAAGIDLCLHMIRADYGAAIAGDVSRRMVAAINRSGGQAQFIPRELPDRESSLAATCEWAIAEMQRPLTVADLAAHAHFSNRTLARRFVEETGMAPMRWLSVQRVLEARRLLEATDLPIEEVALRCGLGTAANLRVHLARELDITPTGYRQAFRDATGIHHLAAKRSA
jgi:transcriptional regulator GlxA family with amidase domain